MTSTHFIIMILYLRELIHIDQLVWIQSPSRSFRHCFCDLPSFKSYHFKSVIYFCFCLKHLSRTMSKIWWCYIISCISSHIKLLYSEWFCPFRPAGNPRHMSGSWACSDIVSWRKYSLAKILGMLQLHLYHLLWHMKCETDIEDSFIMSVVNNLELGSG